MAAATRDLERLYRERFAGFVGALGAVVGDAHVAEECVQAAFVTAVASAASFRGGSLAAWVWRIAVNRAHGRARTVSAARYQLSAQGVRAPLLGSPSL